MLIKQYSTIDSTLLLAKKIKPKPWTVIVALEQENGYGRKGGVWYSPRGGLYMTIVLPNIEIKNCQILTFLAALAVAEVIKDDFKIEPFIKLPNDIWVQGKKIAGILTENIISSGKIKFSIIGIGLNTNIKKFPSNLKKQATSLEIVLNKKINNINLLKKIVNKLQKSLDALK